MFFGGWLYPEDDAVVTADEGEFDCALAGTATTQAAIIAARR